MTEEYDVIIVGGASAGLTAGIYAARRNLKTLILTIYIGGQASMASLIENYPGFLGIDGFELIQKFAEQAQKFGVEIIFDKVIEIKDADGEFVVKTDSEDYKAKAVILSFGKSPKELGVPGEEEYKGRGVSYCATCDMPLFRGRTIAVIGGENPALDAALLGGDMAKRVYLIHNGDGFRGFKSLVESVKKKENIELILDSSVKEIRGDKRVNSIVVQNLKTNDIKELEIDGVVVEIGYEVKTDFIKDLVKLDNYGQIVINQRCETYYPNSDRIRHGIFAAGDVTSVPFKQIVVSAGEGCKAALQAYNYIHKKESYFVADWVHTPKK